MSKQNTFEEAITALEASVQRLENGSLSLEESIEEFEKAVKLIKICNEKLNKAEQKVKMLVKSDDGSVYDRDFTDTTDET